MPKRDAAARWRAVIHEFTSGGETVAAFCARHGLATPTFYQWRRRLGASKPTPALFLPVRVASTVAPPSAVTAEGGVEVVLRGGRRLRLERGFDPQVLAAALATLEGVAC